MTQATGYSGREVFIIDGARTPFLKVRGRVGPFMASDLAVNAARQLLNRYDFPIDAIDEIVVGSILPKPSEASIARLIGLRLGCHKHVPGLTVNRNCGSGMQALDSAAKDISDGRADLVLAGGTEAMSHYPLPAKDQYVNWLGRLSSARSWIERLRVISSFSPRFLVPDRPSLLDPSIGLTMGQTAQNLAEQFQISREAMDTYSVQSHQRLAQAREAGRLDEVIPLIAANGTVYDVDDGVRPESTVEALMKLRAVFDKRFGDITAGNSSQVSDGAAMVLLASADAVKKYNLPVMGKIVDCHWGAVAPEIMGLGPVHASVPLMQRQKLAMSDIDYWEINEAFAAQVLACQAAFADKDFCEREFSLKAPVGSIDPERLNVDGGAVAMGHPVGASGARIVFHLLKTLERNDAKRGMASICIGGGQGGAMLIERVS